MANQVFGGFETTPLLELSVAREKTGLLHLYVKDEGVQPHGTWKDRRSRAIIERVRGQAVDTLALITSGNAGYSLGQMAKSSDLRVVAVVDEDLPEEAYLRLRASCSEVVGVDLSHEIFGSREIELFAKRHNSSRRVLDVTNGFHDAYGTVVDELREQLNGEQPKYIFCPVGSGEAFFGMYQALQRLQWSTKLIGASTIERPSIADKLHALWTPYRAYFGEMMNHGHRVVLLHEGEIRAAYLGMRDIISIEPSSAAAFAALKRVKLFPNETVVVVNSGKG